MSKVVDLIYKHISKNVSTAYLFSGGSIMGLVDKFNKTNNYNNIKYYVPSSEMSAGFCSIGHNKSLNKLDSVVITTSGPGLTNILTPLTDAYCDNVPFFVISGDVSTDMKGTHAFQEAPSLELTKPICYWNHTLTQAHDIDYIMKYCFHLTSNNKTVHLNIPKNILNMDSKENISNNIIKKDNYNCNIYDIINISNIINNSIKPVLYVGKGCNNKYSSDLLTQLAIKGNIPVTTTLHGLGAFDESHDLSLKMLGMHGSEKANHAIQNADCIICIGARFDDRTVGNVKYYAPLAKNIIHINTDISSFNKVISNTINIHGKAEDILKLMLKYIKYQDRFLWKNLLNKYTKQFKFNNDNLKQQHILEIFNNELNKLYDINKKSIITTGVGNHQMYTAQLLTHKYPGNFITSGSLGTMGSSNSMAIGAKIANPNNIIFSIDGDQSFNMLNDLKMIMNYNISIKMIIMNDSKQSMVNVWEKLFFNNNITATETINPNYELLCNAYNIKCITIDETMSYDIIRDKIKTFILYDFNSPILLNCIVNSDYCLPLVPPGNALNDMLTIDNINDYKLNNNSIPS